MNAWVLALPCVLLAASSPHVHADTAADPPPLHGSLLAYPLVSVDGERPDLVFAQRTIQRSWGRSEDSTYREVDIPGWKSEPGAFTMSLAVPGTGQLYAGERRGYAFLLVEAVSLYQIVHLSHTADQLDQKARSFAGNPTDSTSRWAFETWAKRSGQDPASLEALYAADPSLFYYEIGHIASLQPGWSDYGTADQMSPQFVSQRDDAELRRKHQKDFIAVLWVNHLVAAFDALRAARMVNLPLQHNLDLHMKAGWRGGSPTLSAVLERTF
jgi:hypothetical protein